MGTNVRIYRAKPLNWGLGRASTGTEQVAVELGILTPGADFNVITWYGFLSEKALERSIESLRYMGWKGDDISDIQGLEDEVDLVIEDEEYQGKTTTRVRWVNKIGGVNLKAPLTGDDAKSFGASLKDRIRALDAAKGVKKPTAKQNNPRQGGAIPPEPPPLTDEDLNF